LAAVLIILVGSISTIIPSSYAVQDLQKIECVDNNLNINGIDLNQLTQQQQDQIKRLAGIDYKDTDTQNSNYNDNDYGLSDDSFSVDNNLVNICVNANLNHQKVTPPPPPTVLSLNKEWFVCDEEEDIDCTVRSESDITFETPGSGNYTACTEQDDNCPFVADTGLNIQISGNGPTPNTIPALIGTQATVDIGPGDFDVTESLSTESQSLFPQLPITVGFNPTGIAYDNATERMYVANSFSNTVSVIDTTTNTVIGLPIPVGSFPESIAYDPVNERMYVANFNSGTVSVIDTTTNMVIGTPIPLSGLKLLAYDPVNERMYVTVGNNAVSVLYLSANKVCQASGFDAGELRTYESNGQMIQQITCVNFVGECSGNIQEGETKECTVQDYAVRVNDITDTPIILTTPNQETDQQEQQETEDEEQKDTTDKELSAKLRLNVEIPKK
jgi:YVTN family beta-propeller protein